MIGKKIKVNDYKFTYGQGTTYINVYAVFKYIKNGNTIATCNMDVIPKEGDDVIIKSRALKVRKILWWIENPSNTYVEKMGFDVLLYQLRNYHVFNFNSLNEIINNFLDKFELVGIKLTKNDFDYTCYVYEYMSSFLEIRYSSQKNYDKLSELS